jgi:hypothetical protein
VRCYKACFEVPTSLNARLGERAFRLYEIIKVTPISGMSEYFSNTQNFAELPRYALPHLRDQVVNSLAEGQTLLVSTYTGAEAEARVSLTATPFFSVRVGGNLTETARTTIYHPHGQYFVNWSAEKSSGEGLALNLFDRIIQVPLAKEAWRKAHHLESTFVFDDSGAEKELLLQNLVKPDASSLPDHFRWEKRDTDSRSRESSLSFLGLRTGKRLVNKLETHYENFQQEYNSHTKTVSIGTESTRLRDIVKAHWAKTAEVLVNTSGEVAVCMDFDLDYPSAEKEKLLPILNRYRSFFPDSLFLFNPEYVKHYMGNVTANAKTFYNQAMLEKLFADSWTKETMCNVYAPSCNTSFFNHFARVRKSFSTLKLNGAAARDRFYKRMARFFLDHAESTEFAKIVLGASALKQDAQINSELAAFPGDEASLASSPADAIPASTNPTLFSDKIEDSLKNVFFAPATQ